MKKGFTLIEIIVCISLITIISTSSFFIIKKVNNSSLTKVNKKILEAAMVYSDKYNIDKNVQEYAKGAKIPIKLLYDEGYISENDYTFLEKNNPDKSRNINKYYVLLSNEKDYCNDGAKYTLSWTMDENEVVYLCDKEKIQKIDNSLFSKITNQDYTTSCSNLLSEESLLCLLHGKNLTDNNEDVYYFRGKDVNNYLKIKGSNESFRIVRTVEDNNIKIVSQNSYDSQIYKSTSVSNDFADNGDDAYAIDYELSNDNGKIAKIFSRYYIPGKGNKLYICTTNEEIDYDWTNDVLYNFSCAEPFYGNNTTKQFQIPYYLYVYKPLQEIYRVRYKNILENYIYTDYKWCDNTLFESNNYSNISLKCQLQKNMNSNIGLLNIAEYKSSGILTLKDNLGYHNSFLYDYDLGHEGCSSSEVVLDLKHGIKTAVGYYSSSYYCGFGHPDNGEQQKFRPAFVIKGTSKVISGDGTSDDPYLIDGFVE